MMKRMHWERLWLLPVIAVVAVTMTGCPPRSQRVAGTAERVTQVSVSLTEFAIGMNPESAPAGDVVFNVKNNGKAVHAFEIEGQGIEEKTRNLQSGERETLRVENLGAGTYEVYCPVGRHEERGMKGTFTVTE